LTDHLTILVSKKTARTAPRPTKSNEEHVRSSKGYGQFAVNVEQESVAGAAVAT
jgi:hypothetical protein